MNSFKKLIIPQSIIIVKELRVKIKNKDDLLSAKPGVYKFWADEETFIEILNGYKNQKQKFQNISFNEIKDSLEKMTVNSKNVYCFYVGRADKRALAERIKGHINKNGGSSLNHKLQNIIAKDYEKFMDSLYFTCDLFDVEVRSYSAALITSQQELFEINSYLRILNDDDNFLLNGEIV